MRKTTVMIIDGEPFFRAGVHQVLSQHDDLEIAECDPGEDGSEAIARITSNSPDVALLNTNYPELKGLDLGRKIARSFPATKVVAMSASSDEDDDELFEVIKTGAVAYLKSRTCTADELVEMVRQAAKGEYPINESLTSRPKVAWRVLKQFQDMTATGMTIEEITTPLTSKEVQILTLVAEGNTNKRIATTLGISEQTIKNHVSAILRKLNANDRAHAVFLALRNGWITIQAGNNGKSRAEHIIPGQGPEHPS